ncbi:putative ABC transporter C family member 15, partial [Tanacetum coccineum]
MFGAWAFANPSPTDIHRGVFVFAHLHDLDLRYHLRYVCKDPDQVIVYLFLHEKLAHFRIKKLKDILTPLGLSNMDFYDNRDDEEKRIQAERGTNFEGTLQKKQDSDADLKNCAHKILMDTTTNFDDSLYTNLNKVYYAVGRAAAEVRAAHEAGLALLKSLLNEHLDEHCKNEYEKVTNLIPWIHAEISIVACDIPEDLITYHDAKQSIEALSIEGSNVALEIELGDILGEIPRVSGGKIRVFGSKGFVPQSAWIQIGTIRDNILFGRPMNKGFYYEVVDGCGLAYNFETLIADVYLLDDPFSDVDAHTGTDMFEKCLINLLHQKSVIYIMHQLEFLSTSDLILVIKDGGIHQAGKYRDLVEDPTNHFSQDESNVASPKSDISVDDESSSTTGILEMIMVRDVKAGAECPPLPAVGSQVWLFSGRCDQNLQIKDIAKHETGTTEFCTNKKLETKESREA